tara:strand:+ start:342 stop:875 length:534 start_codon:yes stop_codon:yes gene_type:complete
MKKNILLKQKKLILIIMCVLALFYLYDYGSNSIFSSKEKFYTCEVGMVKKQNVINDGGPEIMVLKFNLKTKLPNAYINDHQKLRNGTYKIEEASSTQHVADYELRFKLKTMHNHTITYEGYSGRTEIVNEFIINRINLKIGYIKITRYNEGETYHPINKRRQIKYGKCEATKPWNKI